MDYRRQQDGTKRQTDGLVAGTNIMDTIMDRETRHRKLMAMENRRKELDKATPQAVEYPHVYGAPTGGNILNAFGKRYALPLGTERYMEDVITLIALLMTVLRRDCCAICATEHE